MSKEATILTVQQNGSERCELSPNSSFVRIRVPLRALGDGPRLEATFSFSIGSFTGGEIKLVLEAGFERSLGFRIPQELFRPGEHLILEVLSERTRGPKMVLWSKRYQVAWRGKEPYLEPAGD
jgi:hypothetical protein